MGMLYEPVVHRCAPPTTAFGISYELGSWWRCDGCGALWEFTSTTYCDDWMHRRPTKRTLRRIARVAPGVAAMLRDGGPADDSDIMPGSEFDGPVVL